MIQSEPIILQLNCCSITGTTLVYKCSQVFSPKYVSVNQMSTAHHQRQHLLLRSMKDLFGCPFRSKENGAK